MFSIFLDWGCVSKKVIENTKRKVDAADELDGFEELEPADQEKVKTAWEEGHVADEDIPESARKHPANEGDDDDEKPKKRAPARKKVNARFLLVSF